MAHELSVTLTDEEYMELSAEAVRNGKQVEAFVRDILAQRLQRASPAPYPMTSRAFTEQQYREGKVLALPTREPLSGSEAAARERRAQLLKGGTPASQILIEDRGPR